MTEEKDNDTAEEAREEATNPVGGERLAVARREQQISVLEVAKELHLDEVKVRALERNEFDVLGAPVFAKGHLRKYAQLVGANEDDLFADYYQLTRAERTPPPIVVGRKKARQELSPGPWIAVIIVVLAAAIAYWWFGVREPAPATPAPAPVEESDSNAVLEEEPPESETVVLATALPEPDTEMPAEAAASAVDPEPVPEILPDGDIRLSLAFSGDCWTEISDANGRRLFFGMGRSGRDVELTGPAPFDVLLGNADNVAVRVNDNPFTIPAAARNNRTARLTILEP